MSDTTRLYYKHVTIVNYDSSSINELKASLNDDARVVIYNHHMFIVQATQYGASFTIVIDEQGKAKLTVRPRLHPLE